MSAWYRIHLRGDLDAATQEAFTGWELHIRGQDIFIAGMFDQSALHGLLERVRLLQLELLEVRRLYATAVPGLVDKS